MLNSAALFKELERFVNAFLSLIYSAECALCNQGLDVDDRYLCESCVLTIRPLPEPLCSTCASPLPPFQARKNYVCTECRGRFEFIDSGSAFFPFSESVKSLIHQAKFDRKFWLLKTLCRLGNAQRQPSLLSRYDVMVPVPLDHQRLKSRGFNQTEMIAKELAGKNHSHKIVLALKKVKSTKAQSELHRTERLLNLNRAFQVRKHSKILNRSVLLVDDVVTSGATVNECARMLKEAGAKRVDFIALARTIHL